ncbi:MAG TPA: tetratricopeptide repeat protein [Terracidiphilus sp.]|jgi:tetratricopeptide (TPR) repeat protein|nr:tetratricopeptide repeat protein [Terracidiphilus sp.]
MNDPIAFLKIAFLWALAGVACAVNAQTYQVGPDASQNPQAKKDQNQAQTLGFGKGIQNARIARAAELALQHGQKAQALDYSRRAVHVAPNEPQLWFLLGYAARLNGRYQESEQAYQHGLSLNPSSLEGTSGLAQDYSLVGRPADAERLLKQVLTADPRRRDDLLLMGELHMRAKDYQGGLDWLTRAERLHPDARSEVLLAVSYQQMKRLDQADHYLELARHRDPNNPDVERSLAGYYRETGKYDDAVAALKAIRSPRPDVLAELGYTYELDGKMTESANTYAKAANAEPKDIGLQLSAAQAQIAAGTTEEADPFLKRAAGIDADNYRLHALRGEIARMQDRSDDAVKEYLAAINHLPGTPVEGPLYGIQLHIDLMQLYKSVGDDNAAGRELGTAQLQIGALDEQGPGSGAFLRLRAVIKLAAGNVDGALADVHEALANNANDRDDLQLDGDILMKMGRTEDAIAAYKRVLDIDANNRFALISLGYASRAAGRNQDAEHYFKRLAQVDPSSYVPYLALGDLETSRRQFPAAQANYSKAYALSPNHGAIVAGGMNAATEAHNVNLAGEWAGRVTEAMNREPDILRERERYLSFKGDYQQSAAVGEQAIQVLPHDRDVVVYLGYDLLHMEKWDDLLKLANENSPRFPKEPDLPLFAGYVHKHNGQMEQARQDFSDALERDPEVVTAYVNRGYILNDLHQPKASADDFDAALKREPKNGEAHLGLGYSDLDLHKPGAALRQADLAEQAMGDMRDVHVIRATAYGRLDILNKAAAEYRAAIKFTPDDGALHLGLGNTLFAERQYHPAIDELQIAAKSSPDDATVYAMLARAYANLGEHDQTVNNARTAERLAQNAPIPDNDYQEPLQSTVYVDTGEAFSTLGDQKAALDRFTKALETPKSNRLTVRLALAHMMSDQGRFDDAERQVALGLMEAGTGETVPASGGQFIEAADVFRGTHDFQLSQDYLQRAKTAGAPDAEVRIGMANNYLAVGDTTRAKAELAAVNNTSDGAPDYQYLLAQANVFRQEHQGPQALTSFAQATNAEGEDQTAEEGLLQASGAEGWQINPKVSMLSDLSVSPIYEDSTVYVLDSKLDAGFAVNPGTPSLLPPPRSSLQTQWTDAFHLHLNHLSTASGFFQLRNARGQISVPATNTIVNRNTTDSTLNFGLNPTIRMGTSVITFNSGIQATIRRDSLSPAAMNQNLFRLFTYMSTSSLFDAISISGYVIRESGPFTEINLSSSQLTGALDFRVGSPWGRTAMVTGWGRNKQTFSPANFQNYYTSAYIGLEHRFGEHLNVRAMVEDLRAWRVVGTNSAIAQDLRPAGSIDYNFKRNWNMQFSSAYSSTRGFHAYDNSQNGFSISYAMPFRHKRAEEGGPLTLAYPIRFAGGVQDDTFFNFSGKQNQQLRPFIGITIF